MLMKKIILLIGVLFLCLSLISCGTGNEEQTPEETVKPLDDKIKEIYDKCGVKFEPNRSDLPTYEQLTQIKPGMTYKEVCALVGHPQNWDIGRKPFPFGGSSATSAICFIYKSSDGKSIKVFYSGPVDESYIMHVDTIR